MNDQMQSHNILDLLDYGRSRYLDDFIQVRRLGKGAFGAVFEVNLLYILLFYHFKYIFIDYCYFVYSLKRLKINSMV